MKYGYNTIIEKIDCLENPNNEDAYNIIRGMIDKSISIDKFPSFYDDITKIDSAAFAGCTKLTSMFLPEKITNIESGAFSGCTNLTDIYVSWSEGEVANAPWGATNATIHYGATLSDPAIVYEDGKYHYYEYGTLVTKAGIRKYDENYIIYVVNDGSLVTGAHQTAFFIRDGGYNFATDGVYYPSSYTDVSYVWVADNYNDVVKEKDGALYYYKNDICIKNAGEVPIYGESGRIGFMYVQEDGKLATGVCHISPTTCIYDLGTTGRLLTHNITFNCTNVGSSYNKNWIATTKNDNGEIQPQIITLSEADNCTISSVTVLMGNRDITATSYADGVITITEVTDDITIFAVAE